MSKKKIALFVLMSVISMFSGAVFGLVDLFGFIDGRHTLSLTLLAAAAILTYLGLVNIFLLNFTQKSRVHTFLFIATIFFGVSFFVTRLDIILTLLTSIAYFIFFTYAYSASVERSRFFVQFKPREIFFPILRSSFTYFLIILTLLTYIQSQRLISENTLITPGLIRFASRPTVVMLNQQINSQLQSSFESPMGEMIQGKQRELVVRRALEKTLESMANPQTNEVYGIDIEDIPIERAIVTESGTVDIAPVIEAMLPQIAALLNEKVQEYGVFVPFIVALVAFLLLQPIIIPLNIFESIMTVIIFKILLATGFIHIRKEQREVEVPYL